MQSLAFASIGQIAAKNDRLLLHALTKHTEQTDHVIHIKMVDNLGTPLEFAFALKRVQSFTMEISTMKTTRKKKKKSSL
jgi:hypothetical protein